MRSANHRADRANDRTRVARARKGALPLGSYSFGVVQVHDRKEYIHQCLQPIDAAPHLKGKQAQKLRKLVAGRTLDPPGNAGSRAMSQLERDLEANAPVLKKSVALATAKDLGVVLDADDFELRVEQIDAEDFRTETNLGEVAGLDDPAVHKAVERGLLGVGGLNQRIEYMERHRAVAGFRNDDLPLFEEKLGFLARQLDPDAQVERFDRVLDLIDLPDVANDPGTRDVDIARLLEILESEEAREFRSWLRGLDALRDNEVEQEIRKLRDLVRRAVRSSAGKGVRFAATTGVGLIPGAQLAGLGLGALDAFVLERLVPEAGPTAFLSQLYPTVFVS